MSKEARRKLSYHDNEHPHGLHERLHYVHESYSHLRDEAEATDDFGDNEVAENILAEDLEQRRHNDKAVRLSFSRKSQHDEQPTEIFGNSSPPSYVPSVNGDSCDEQQLSVEDTDSSKKDNNSKTLTSELEDLAHAPYCALNPGWQRIIAFIICFAGMISPLTANVFFPIIPSLSRDLHVPQTSINLLVTYYMIVQGVSPTIWASIADCIGRRNVYILTMIIFIGTSVGIGQTDNYSVIAFLRAMQALGSASVIAIGSGTIGDVFPPERRGFYISMFSIGAQLGPCIGPVFSALLEERWGWPCVFYWLACMGGLVLITLGAFVPETLRSIAWNGSVRPPTVWHRSWYSLIRQALHGGKDEFLYDEVPKGMAPKRKTWRDIRPWWSLVLLVTNLQMTLMLVLYMVVYGVFYMLLSSLSGVFQEKYELTVIQTGLCFLANGVGNIAGATFNGNYSTWEFRRQRRLMEERLAKERAEKGEADPSQDIEKTGEQTEAKSIPPSTKGAKANDLDDFPLEKARFRLLPINVFMVMASAFVYGWCVEYKVHLSVPLIFQFIYGFFMTGLFNSINTYIVDINPEASSSATAANNLLRCLFGAACSGFVVPMIDGIGDGWTFTVAGFLILLCSPIVAINGIYGQRWRKARSERKRRREAERIKEKEGRLESQASAK